MIHTYVITTLHVDAVVLCPCLFIHFVGPVGVVVVHIIIIVARLGLEELERVVLRAGRSNQLGSIHAELLRVHHVGELRNQLIAAANAHVNLGGH